MVNKYLEQGLTTNTMAICLVPPDNYSELATIPFQLCIDHCFDRGERGEQTLVVVFYDQTIKYKFESSLRDQYIDFDDFSENNKEELISLFSDREFPRDFVDSLTSDNVDLGSLEIPDNVC